MRWMPEDYLIVAGMDTSTLIRLFEGKWGSSEFKVYQNLFKIHLCPTVYKEFFNYQNLKHPVPIARKEQFLRLLGCEIDYPDSLENNSTDMPPDQKIITEFAQQHIILIITDNVQHFEEYARKFSEIWILDGNKLGAILKQGMFLLPTVI